MLEFLGHLHPVIVHLPIGILLLACLFMWQSRKNKSENLQPFINIILFWGMTSATAACITGFILSQSGGYDDSLVNWHQWMGITVALITIGIYFFRKKPAFIRRQWIFGCLLVVLLFITGHLGGSLTHGPEYLSQPLRSLLIDDTVVTIKRKPIPNIQEAMVYADLVQPVLQTKCYTCHGASKQKGRLRMDRVDLLLKGGKDGVVIVPGKATASELVKRIQLPKEDDHHMAPKDKPQLTAGEVTLLGWWVDNGADFSKKVKDLQQTDKIKPVLVALQTGNEEQKAPSEVPDAPVEKAEDGAIQKLKNLGAVVIPVSQNSNYLEVNFVTAVNITDKDMALLLPLKKQLVWLKAGNTRIGDTSLAIIGQLVNLVKLQLDHTAITDKGLPKLAGLHQLQSLNLAATGSTVNGIRALKNLKQLRTLYLFQSHVERSYWNELKKLFPKVSIDSGGYAVPLLETDTTLVKPPKTK